MQKSIMQKLINFLSKYALVVLIILITIPTFARMLRPGIYSMQDFHFFRLFEFNKCIEMWTFPCRWAPDAGLGYGEPLFNFYGQLPYLVGEIFYKFGLSFNDSIKALFIFTIVGSGVSMFFLSKKIWKNNFSAIISSVLYVYAPYRAVDIWVRGALPEAFSFLIFPLIVLSIEANSLLWFSVTLSLLVLTHNLSLVLFLPILIIWAIYKKFWKVIPGSLMAFCLSAFYVLPVIFESKYVNLESTIRGYFDFRAHFVTLSQIFLSRFWGYGGSTWGTSDGLSLSVGQVQWVLIFVVLILVLIKWKNFNNKNFFILFFAAVFYLFLTHNKSSFIWESLPFMAYIQFPWRFLGVATFCLSLASGVVVLFFRNNKIVLTTVIVLAAIILNVNYFREDIWYNVSDNYFLAGQEWDRQRSASIGDFWPNFGHPIPQKPSEGLFINYFPGWIPDNHNNGLIPKNGSVFKDTTTRKIGNAISLLSVVSLLVWVTMLKWKKEV